MAKLDEIAADPNYEAAATAASKATIVVFIATFGYLAFFSGTSPGIIGGAAFFLIGIFVVSLAISAPLFLLRAKAPRLGLLISIADIAVTIFITRAVYLWLFAQPATTEIQRTQTAQSVTPVPAQESTLQLRYFRTLDNWVERGTPLDQVQDTVVATCSKLVVLTASSSERLGFVSTDREEFDFRVDVCTKMTINRVHPQPEFEDKAMVSMMCDESEVILFSKLCVRSGPALASSEATA